MSNGRKIKAKFESKCKKDESHTWKEGDEIYFDIEKKTICKDLECYKSQGGDPISFPDSNKSGGKSFGKPSMPLCRDPDEGLKASKIWHEVIHPMLLQESKDLGDVQNYYKLAETMKEIFLGKIGGTKSP